MLLELIYYFVIGYLVYKGILFIARLFKVSSKRESDDSRPPKSRFKDVEEANYTEIKDDKDKDKGNDPH